jgi:2,4-dienoyl-CoA reductase-like NADH-dependent reductase (Old Yellow Enzyme family)
MSDADRIRSVLSKPFVLPNGQVVKNRLLKSAMSETLGTGEGQPTEALLRLYRQWADGGIGLMVTGNVMVDRDAFAEPGNVCVEDDRDLPLLQQWAEVGKSGGGLIYMQISHPGRQVPRFLNPDAVAPSAVPWQANLTRYMAAARELENDEITEIMERFAATARIAAEAGFDGVQIHGAHGYLVSQFLSPHTNQRTDAWGGSPAGRRKFVLEVIRTVREATPDGFGIAIKINSADFQRGGITEEESMDTVLSLGEEGLQFIEVSGGTYEAPAMMSGKESTREREAYFLTFAEAVRERLQTPLVVTGGFRSGKAMADAIEGGAVDLVGMARPLAVRPDFPNALLEEGDVRQEVPPIKTGIGLVDRLGMTDLLFYERQLHRMGRGKRPALGENALKALCMHMLENGLKALKPRRAR